MSGWQLIAIAAIARCSWPPGDLMRIAAPNVSGFGRSSCGTGCSASVSASAGVITPCMTGASQTWSISVIAGLNEAAALCAI